MYCLSSTLKHSDAAVARFSELDGWSTLSQTLQGAFKFLQRLLSSGINVRQFTVADPSLTLRSKTAFLLSQLISQSSTPSNLLATLRTSSTLSTLLSSLSPSSATPTGPDGDSESIDPDYREKALRFLVNSAEKTKGAEGFTEEEQKRIREVIKGIEAEDDWSEDGLGLAKEEWVSFKQAVKA